MHFAWVWRHLVAVHTQLAGTFSHCVGLRCSWGGRAPEHRPSSTTVQQIRFGYDTVRGFGKLQLSGQIRPVAFFVQTVNWECLFACFSIFNGFTNEQRRIYNGDHISWGNLKHLLDGPLQKKFSDSCRTGQSQCENDHNHLGSKSYPPIRPFLYPLVGQWVIIPTTRSTVEGLSMLFWRGKWRKIRKKEKE